jgi:hypothetical protein
MAGIKNGGANEVVALWLFDGLGAPPSFSHLATSSARWSWTSFGSFMALYRNDDKQLRANVCAYALGSGARCTIVGASVRAAV